MLITVTFEGEFVAAFKLTGATSNDSFVVWGSRFLELEKGTRTVAEVISLLRYAGYSVSR